MTHDHSHHDHSRHDERAHGDGHAHGHQHPHAEAHDGEAAPEWHQARMHEEDLVLDIGGDVGALVIDADASWAEREVEISRLGDARRTHTAIHERHIGGEWHYVGVFPELQAGEYQVWVDAPGLVDRVTVVGGEVTTLAWTTPAPRLPTAAPGSEEQAGT